MGTFYICNQDDKLCVLAENLITNLGRNDILDAIAYGSAPHFNYIAVGIGTTAPGSTQTALDEEIYRMALSSSWVPGYGTVRLLGVIGPMYGNGDWKEIGIFSATDKRGIISVCDGTVDWTSDGTLTQETSTVQEGAASVECTMGTAGTVAFLFGGTPALAGYSFGTADYLQLWYYTTYDVGTVSIRTGDNATNYYSYDWPVGGTSTWLHLHAQLNDMTAVGTPGTTYAYFRMTHPAAGTTFTEYLDYITLFGTAGNMLARATVDTDKAYNTVRNVYYSLKWGV